MRREKREVLEVQRSRIVAAAIAVAEAQGHSRLTVAAIIGRARVSRKTFYDLFDDCEDCLLAAFELATGRAREVARAAYSSETDWRSGMRAGVLSVLQLMDREPALARVCIVDTLAAKQPLLDRRADLLRELADAIDLGRALTDAEHEPQPLISHAIAGGIAGVLHTRLLREQEFSPEELLGAFMSMIVMPYLGRAAACEELKAPQPRPAPRERREQRQVVTNPLADLDIRVTYRTVRVLMAIAKAPGASNREIAREAGIVDQGQISKLLRRLEGLELIENTGEGQLKGMANAWRLTRLGAQVQRATEGR